MPSSTASRPTLPSVVLPHMSRSAVSTERAGTVALMLSSLFTATFHEPPDAGSGVNRRPVSISKA
jgi:hypothetical protein